MTETTSQIFVFASNLAGLHGAGSAREALDNHGALWRCGVGPQGDSYAIPTKDEDFNVLPTDVINFYVKDFLRYAAAHSEMQFNIVAIGCGLAGYKPADIAPMFEGASKNCRLPEEFMKFSKEDMRGRHKAG